MSAIRRIDQGIRNIIFSMFWFLIDPLDKERLLGQLKDKIERHLDINNPDIIYAPDNFEVQVNNKIFIKHAHSIKKLENILADQLQKYVADRDYELSQPRVKLQILSSSTLSKRKVDIRTWFSDDDAETVAAENDAAFEIIVVEGDGNGKSWPLDNGGTYTIGRHSSAAICLPYDKISKTQATLYFISENKITLIDEGSSNGTYIDDDDDRVDGKRDLKVGSRIRLCKQDPIVLVIQAR